MSTSAEAATTLLDRAALDESLDLVALRVPARKCSEFTKRLSGHMFNRPNHRVRVKPVVADPSDGAARLVLLSEAVQSVELAELPAELREFCLAEGACPVYPHTLRIGYEHLSAEQALRRLLPAGVEVPSAFETVGHVAHVNLRDEHTPYKGLIGQVLLDKNGPRIRSVVNKVESISAGKEEKEWKFRVFPMEVLAGSDDLRTSVRENGARFELDYREVYWNSRLETEHKRIISLLQPSDVVADVFAGIGPFAVPAALKGCRVYANDLNPKSHEFLASNVQLNKVGSRVRASSLDGRAFVEALLGPPAAGGEQPLPFGPFGHVVMNLPASALTFLDAFAGAFDRTRWAAPLPMIHCYCFTKAEDPAADVIRIAEEALGCRIPGASATVVRDVSPQKLMMCLEFRVPDEVAWAAPSAAASQGGAGDAVGEEQGDAKRARPND